MSDKRDAILETMTRQADEMEAIAQRLQALAKQLADSDPQGTLEELRALTARLEGTPYG